MDYNEYVSTMRTMLVVPDNDANFTAILPSMIQYATDRISRELDLINLVGSEVVPLTPNARSVAIPTVMNIIQSANVVTPLVVSIEEGTRHPLQRVSVEFLNYAWPQAGQTDGFGYPKYYAVLNTETALIAPAATEAYKLEFVGTRHVTYISDANPSSYISETMPDLLVAASMVFGAGYQRDFGAQSDDPKLAQSWEAQYQVLIASETVSEARRKAQSVSWQAYSPAKLATPPRS